MNNTVTKLVISLTISEEIILDIISTYQNMSVESLVNLISATTFKGCRFVNIKGYNSDKSDNTEIADYLVNVGSYYDRAKDKAYSELSEYTPDNVCEKLKDITMSWNLSRVGLNKFTDKANPHMEIFNMLPDAVRELQAKSDTPKVRENNNIKLNDVLWFNTVTKNLNLFCKVVKKTTISADTSGKVVQSAPITIAKDIIRSTFKTNGFVTLTIPNMLGTININRDVLELS